MQATYSEVACFSGKVINMIPCVRPVTVYYEKRVLVGQRTSNHSLHMRIALQQSLLTRFPDRALEIEAFLDLLHALGLTTEQKKGVCVTLASKRKFWERFAEKWGGRKITADVADEMMEYLRPLIPSQFAPWPVPSAWHRIASLRKIAASLFG